MTLDYSGLHSPATFKDIDAAKPGTVAREFSGALFGAGFWLGLPLVVVVITEIIRGFRDDALVLAVVLAPFALIALAFAAGIFGSAMRRWRMRVRLRRFAAANGMRYRYDVQAPSYPGARFRPDSSGKRTFLEKVEFGASRPVIVGNYQLVRNTGKYSESTEFGFMAVRLGRTLPNMVLLPNGPAPDWLDTNTSRSSRGQVLKLEGDFDAHFTLYAPAEYKTDALYVFTPDVMAALIDNAANFIVEIVDDWMFVHPRAGLFKLADQSLWVRLMAVLDAVTPELLKQGDNYRDDRVESDAPGTIGRAGRRLLPGNTVGNVLSGTLVMLVIIAAIVTPIILDGLRP